LLELAAIDADAYAEHLHRGIGLYLLAQEAASAEGDDDTESILCKAALELIDAHHESPHEARPCWYLHLIWRQLGQAQPAGRWLREATDHAPLSYLTPEERHRLSLRLAELT
jgi:hypothetical protein